MPTRPPDRELRAQVTPQAQSPGCQNEFWGHKENGHTIVSVYGPFSFSKLESLSRVHRRTVGIVLLFKRAFLWSTGLRDQEDAQHLAGRVEEPEV